jgi:hypothetical protein
VKRNLFLGLVVLTACVMGSALGGCGSCAGGNDPPPPQAQQPPFVPASGSVRQIRAPMMGVRPTGSAAATDAATP